MSTIATTRVRKWAPSAAASIATPAVSTAWASSGWAELLASAAADLTLDQLVYDNTTGVGWANIECEIDIGVGGAGSETVVASFHLQADGSIGQNSLIELISPFAGVAAGQRVAVRGRHELGSSISFRIALGYREANDADVATGAHPKCVPAGGAGPSIAANTTDWANSAYVQLTSGLDSAVTLASLSRNLGSVGVIADGEIDIAGGGAGSEVVLATITMSGVDNDSGRVGILYLSALVPVVASTRLSLRWRKAGTAAYTLTALSLNYYQALQILGSTVFGVNTTVTAPRAFAFGLDGGTHVHNEAGKGIVYGDFEVTGAVTLPGSGRVGRALGGTRRVPNFPIWDPELGEAHSMYPGIGPLDAENYIDVEIDGTHAAGLTYQARVEVRVGATWQTITPKIRNITDSTDAGVGSACTAADGAYGGTNQKQTIPLTIPTGVKKYRLQYTLGSPSGDSWAIGEIESFAP